MMKRKRRPTPPGRILKTYFLEPRELTVTQLAASAGMSRKHASKIINGSASISPGTAVRFAAVLGTTPEFWLNLQNAVDLYDARLDIADWRPGRVHPAAMASK